MHEAGRKPKGSKTDKEVWQPPAVDELFPGQLSYAKGTAAGRDNSQRRAAYQKAVEELAKARGKYQELASKVAELKDENAKANNRANVVQVHYDQLLDTMAGTKQAMRALAAITLITNQEPANISLYNAVGYHVLVHSYYLVFELPGGLVFEFYPRDRKLRGYIPGTLKPVEFSTDEDGNLPLKELLALKSFVAAGTPEGRARLLEGLTQSAQAELLAGHSEAES